MERCMLAKQLRDEWRARGRFVPMYPVMAFAPEGLVLGAGTILVLAEGVRQLKSLKGQEHRILALLSAAHGKAVSSSVLRNIERAGRAWSLGDDCLAYIHLAHAGLHPLADIESAAWRLSIADAVMKAGVGARAILQALEASGPSTRGIEKLYNPNQPRVPAGSGRISGQWTRLLSWIASLNAAEMAELGLYAARLATPAAVFGLLFIPSPNKLHVEGGVPGIPGLRYSWNRDETHLFLTYDQLGGAQRTVALRLREDDVLDDDGKVVGKIIGGNRVAIDTVAVLPDLVKQDEPRLCPKYEPDVAGSGQGKPYEENRARQYEDFVKLLINPPPNGPTPSGFVYYLPLPEGGEQSYDDCKWANGILFEIKGEGLAKLTKDLPKIMADDFVDQATRQLAAGGGRPVVWVFAEEQAARFARDLFDTKGLNQITVVHIPWERSGR
jgi:hypothetical protein